MKIQNKTKDGDIVESTIGCSLEEANIKISKKEKDYDLKLIDNEKDLLKVFSQRCIFAYSLDYAYDVLREQNKRHSMISFNRQFYIMTDKKYKMNFLDRLKKFFNIKDVLDTVC